MNAEPLLSLIARLFKRHRLEAVLIGNAAAALQGAPVTTIDLDFMFRKTPANLKKLCALAESLDAVIMRPFYPVSGLFRIVRDSDGLQLDFMPAIHGVKSFASLRSRASLVEFNKSELLVAALSDIIKSKIAAGRDKDRAVISILQKVADEKEVLQKSESPRRKTRSTKA
jgi:hypothetical protein